MNANKKAKLTKLFSIINKQLEVNKLRAFYHLVSLDRNG